MYGQPLQGDLEAGVMDTYTFMAEAGATYGIETDLNTLEDSVLTLTDSDGQQIAENDDTPNIQDGQLDTASYLEWTCPATGEYTIMVHGFDAADFGTYVLTLSEMGSTGGGGIGGGGGGDPCAAGGATLREQVGPQRHASCHARKKFLADQLMKPLATNS